MKTRIRLILEFIGNLFSPLGRVEIKRWRIETEEYENLELEILEKILSQTEEYFNGTVEDHKNLTNKSYTTLAIYISILGVFISIIYGSISDQTVLIQNYFTIGILTITIILALCIINLLFLIFPKEMMGKGEPVKPLDFNLLGKLKKETQFKDYVFSSIEATQSKIDFNEKLFELRIKKFEIVLKLSTFSFIIFILILMIHFIIKNL